MGPESTLEQLYRDALYEVDLPGGTVAFRIGDAPPRGLPLPLAIITAYNPGLERPGEAANREANRRLEAEMDRRGLRYLSGRGRDVAGGHVEPSFAVIGMPREDALALAAHFGQSAIVYADAGGVALLWCAPPGGSSA
jgi:hypothetical protein